MRKQREWRSIAALATALVTGFCIAGCGGGYKMPTRKPTVKEFHLTHHVGGTHYRVLAHEGRCIQAFANSIQVVDPDSLLVINDIPLGEFGACGPVIDLAISGEQLFAVVEDDFVAELAMPAGLAPKLKRTTTSEQLGIQPRCLSVVNDTVYASGVGGVVNLSNGTMVYRSDDECGSVAMAGEDLVVCIGRRVHRIADGNYVGAASALLDLPPQVSGTDATLAFMLRGDKAGLAGLMTPDVREMRGGKSTVAMPEAINRVRILSGRLYLVGTLRIDWYDIGAEALSLAGSMDILGARDIDQLDARTFIVVGSSGRAIYKLNDTLTDGQFVAAQREASGLRFATGDGLNVLAGSREGAWMYLVNARAELTTRTIETAPPGPRSASTVDAQARISTDGSVLQVTPSSIGANGAPSEPWEYREEKAAKLRTIIAVDGDFWVGHDRGITVLRADGGQVVIDPKLVEKAKSDPSIVLPKPTPVKESVRMPGPVLYLMPLLAGTGACYVSEFGGFGVARFIDEEVQQPAAVQSK